MRPIARACRQARIRPTISFHVLRHTYASLAVQSGMALLALARNLGHADTRMVERHYGHLSNSYLREQVRRHILALGSAPSSEPDDAGAATFVLAPPLTPPSKARSIK